MAVRLSRAASTSSGNGVMASANTTATGSAAIRRAANSVRLAAVWRSARPASCAPMTWMLLGWVRLRWPISEAACAASRRTTVPPSRPATHARASASRLSSCSRATLTCSIRLPARNQLVQGCGVGRPAHRFAQRLVGEHLGQLRQDLQVLLGRLFGHQKHEHQADRAAVRSVEGHGLRQAYKRADRLFQALDAAVRDRHALSESGRAEALAREQAVEHEAARDAVEVLEQQARLLEQALLARGLEVEADVRGGEDLRDEAHTRLAYS